MGTMNNQLNLPAMQATAMEYAKQQETADMKQE